MAVFNAVDVTDQQLDWTIVRDGGLALYWRPEVLAQDSRWLELKGYRIVEFNAAGWNSEEQMHQSLASRLSFPDYYGKNLHALNECRQDDVVVPDDGGLVLVLRHYDRFAKAVQIEAPDARNLAQSVLHILGRAIRHHMLFGRRLMILVQSDDPRVCFENLACIAANWNPREWLARNRGL